jgi:hypothetical protein
MTTRRTQLLTAAAAALEDGQIPLMNPFLSEYEVTADECFSLAEQLAIGARVVAYGLENPRSPEGLAVLMSMARDWS